MSAQLLSSVRELLDAFDHALLHRDTSVCVRMSADEWAQFQKNASAPTTEAAAPVAEIAAKAIEGATVTPATGGEVHVQFQAGDFHALSEAHAAAPETDEKPAAVPEEKSVPPQETESPHEGA